MSCDVGCRCGSDPELLWLWRRPVATAPIKPLAWEPPYAMGATLEKAKRQTNKQTKYNYLRGSHCLSAGHGSLWLSPGKSAPGFIQGSRDLDLN